MRDLSTYVLIDGGVVGSDVSGFLDRFTRLCLSLSTMLKFFNVLWPVQDWCSCMGEDTL